MSDPTADRPTDPANSNVDHFPWPSDTQMIAAHAEWLYERHHDEAAFALVAPLFAGLDPARTPPELALADAAIIHVSNHTTDYDRAHDIGWSTYARDTNRRLRGPAHPRTLGACQTLAWALSAERRYGEAAKTWLPLIAAYQDLGRSIDADFAKVNAAICLHGLGRCGEAIRHAGRAWHHWSRAANTTPGADPATGSSIAHPYIQMLKLCHRWQEASAVEAQARRLLPPLHAPGSLLFLLARADAPLEPGIHEPLCARHHQPTAHPDDLRGRHR